MITFSAFIQSGHRGTRHHLSTYLVSFSVLENKQVRKSFFCRCYLCHIINLLLTKLVRSRWLDIGLVLFLCFDFVSVHKNAKRELDQYPAILTSRLLNNIYIENKLSKQYRTLYSSILQLLNRSNAVSGHPVSLPFPSSLLEILLGYVGNDIYLRYVNNQNQKYVCVTTGVEELSKLYHVVYGQHAHGSAKRTILFVEQMRMCKCHPF